MKICLAFVGTLAKSARPYALVAISLGATASSADYVKLKNSDKDGTAAAGESSYMSSFLENPTEAGYGWDDGFDPDPNKDYLVDSGYTLRTPCRFSDVLESTTFVFPGRSLRIDRGMIAFRSSWNTDSNYATVRIDDLTMARGTLGCDSWARPTRWDGNITIDTSRYNYAKNYVVFAINMSTCYIPAKLIASNRECVRLLGPTSTVSGDGVYRWVSHFEQYRFRFEGDCTEYCATNDCAWGAQAQVATSDFAGSFLLGNAGSLTMRGVSSATIRGNVLSRDGTIRVPTSNTMDILGGINSAFAEFETHVSGGTNVYTRLLSSEPYANTNYVTGGTSTYNIPVNVMLLDENAELVTSEAALNGTLVQISSGATMTVGDAIFDDVTLEVAPGGKLVLTNSFAAITPVKLKLSGTGNDVRMPVVTLPSGKGVLRVEDFTFSDAPQFRYIPSVETTDGIQTLWIENLNPDVKDETTGYVVQTTADGNNVAAFTIGSYNMAGNWSEVDRAPHSKTNYYTAKYFRDKNASSAKFEGDSLTQADIFRLTGTSFLIEDWRVVSNGRTSYDERTGLMTAGSRSTYTFNGCLTVFTTNECPFTLYGGLSPQRYVMNTKIVGASDAAIAAEGAQTRQAGDADAQVVCEFPGDMSEYYGTIYVGTNQTVRLGSWGLTNGTLVARTAYSKVSITASAGAYVPVKRYVTQTSSEVSVPASTELAVTAEADITGTLTKTGAGTLSFGGTATAGADASVFVTEGSFKAAAVEAVEGIRLCFGEGSKLCVDVDATGDLGYFGARNVSVETPFVPSVVDGGIPVLFAGELPDNEANVAVCTISAIAAEPTFALPTRYSKRSVLSSAWRTNVDGSRTFVVHFGKSGLRLVVR